VKEIYGVQILTLIGDLCYVGFMKSIDVVDSKVWFRVLIDSDYLVITLQIADPSSRQRGLPIDARPQISDSNIPTRNNIWSQTRLLDTKTY
jgi:hypothetical protein